MAQVITLAGERLFALKAQNNQQLDIDTFIFAYVPGQDSTAPIDRNEGLPPVNQRVHTQIVQQYGMLNDNAVVYSSVLDSLTGPFQFNWVGLYSSVNQTLVAIQHIPTVVKTVTEPGASGNILNRNFVIEYSGIAELTGITVDPATWQYDFEARLNGMDELTRQLAADMNGKDWFIGDGFKVVPRPTLNTFKVNAGVGYVSGLRVELTADHILTLSSYPQFVYVDAWFEATSDSIWKGKVVFTVTNTEMDDYIDVNGRNHYVFKLSRITAADVVEDLRSNLSPKIPQTTLSSYDSFAPSNTEYNGCSGLSGNRAFIVIGDSITRGNGSSEIKTSYIYQLMRSIWNSFDGGFNQDRGFQYEMNLNGLQLASQPGVSTNGTFVDGGPASKVVSLSDGQKIDVTGIEVATFDIIYDASLSTGNIELQLNGVTFRTITVAGTGYKTTFQTNVLSGRYTKETDILTVKSSGGTVLVNGLLHFRLSTNSPICFVSAESGWTLQHHIDNANSLAEIVDVIASSRAKTIMINVGTNDIFSSLAKTPADYVSNLDELINTYKAKFGQNTTFLVSIPPKSDESIWPAKKGNYYEYVSEILLYCKMNHHAAVRLDKCGLSYDTGLYKDGIHPNNNGHLVLAREYAQALRIPFKTNAIKTVVALQKNPSGAVITYNDTWGFFSSENFNVKGLVEGNVLRLSGMAQPNGSTSTTVGTLPIGYRPKRTSYIVVSTNSGVQKCTINSNGTISIDTVSAWVSFENINLTLDN